jgi:hypothetical protein
VTGTVGITDAHERLHPVEDPSPHWSDSLYFNAWDPSTDAFLMTRIAVLANEARATGGMVVWVGGELTYGYGSELDHLPPSDWDAMSTDGLTYRMLESGQAWAVQLADGEAKAHLEWHGLSPATSYDEHPKGPLPKAVAWGHYEQSCKVTGDLVVGGHSIAFDGYGQRDHSWGFRHWAGLHQWHWVTGFLVDGRCFNLFEVHTHDGTTSVNGFVHGPGGDDYVTAADRVLVQGDDGSASSYELTATTAGGTNLRIVGERAGFSVPVRPAPDQPAVVHETPMRLDADGVAGYGIYEHLVTEFD